MAISDQAFIHPSSIVDLPASVGKDTSIWHFCHVCAGATVGNRCVLGQNTYVASTVRVGDGCRIQNNVSLYDGVILEDDVFLGPSVVFTNVLRPRAFVSRRTEYKITRIRRGATIGANATIVAGVTLGEYCFVAAGAVVTKDIPPFTLAKGVPARAAGWVSRHGEPLAFDPKTGLATCPATGEAYRCFEGRVERLASDGQNQTDQAP